MTIRKNIDSNLPIFIYGLVDPRNNKIRYIGWATNIKKRFGDHIRESRTGLKTHKANWIRQLISENIEPNLIIVEETIYSLRIEKEKYWIQFYGRENLVNGTDGGEGVSGLVMSKEARNKISKSHIGKPSPRKGVKLSSDLKNKLSEIKKGNKNLLGFKFTSESKKKMSLSHKGKIPANKGVPMSDENKKKDSESHMGKQIIRNKTNCKSKYRGLVQDKNSWWVRVRKNNVVYDLGRFQIEEDAARAYDKKCFELYGNQAKLNFPEEYGL